MKLYLEVYKVDCILDNKKQNGPIFVSFTLNPDGIVVKTKPCLTDPIGFKKQIAKFEFNPKENSNIKIGIHNIISTEKSILIAYKQIPIPLLPLNKRINSKFSLIPERPMKETPKIFIKIQLSNNDVLPFKAEKGDLLSNPCQQLELDTPIELSQSASTDDIFSVKDPFLSLMAQHLTSGRSMHRAQFYQQKSSQKIETLRQNSNKDSNKKINLEQINLENLSKNNNKNIFNEISKQNEPLLQKV